MEGYFVNKQLCQPSDLLTGDCSLILHLSCIVLGTKTRYIKCKKMEQISRS